MTIKKRQRTMKYQYHVETAINAAKLSIEMFNRIDGIHSDQASIIFNAQSWELLAKAILIKNNHNIYENNGKSITGEKAVSILEHSLGKITREENQTIQQIISLRNEAMHNVYPELDQEIIIHLIYYSLKSFRNLVSSEFKTYLPKIDKNYLSVSFKEHTFYSHKVGKLLTYSKKYSSDKNRALYILDRACKFAEDSKSKNYLKYDSWLSNIKSKPRKSRIAMHLSIYDYTNNQDNVRFVPVETKKGYKAEVIVERTKRSNDAVGVLVRKSDPEKDYPYLGSELATILNQTPYFIQQLMNHLKMKGNKDFHTTIKTGKKSVAQKYSDKTLSYLQEWMKKNPQWSPYKNKSV